MKETQYSNTPALHHSSCWITIVSGGQTGADRAALDWALAHRVECGGWCPKGRKAEDGPIDPKYPLIETPSAAYLQRTEWNVRDSDATVLFSIEPTLTGGSLKTVGFARKHMNLTCIFAQQITRRRTSRRRQPRQAVRGLSETELRERLNRLQELYILPEHCVQPGRNLDGQGEAG